MFGKTLFVETARRRSFPMCAHIGFQQNTQSTARHADEHGADSCPRPRLYVEGASSVLEDAARL